MTPDDIDRFAARVMTAVYVADVQAVIREAVAEAQQPFLDLADEYARDPVIGRAVASAIRAAATRGDA